MIDLHEAQGQRGRAVLISIVVPMRIWILKAVANSQGNSSNRALPWNPSKSSACFRFVKPRETAWNRVKPRETPHRHRYHLHRLHALRPIDSNLAALTWHREAKEKIRGVKHGRKCREHWKMLKNVEKYIAIPCINMLIMLKANEHQVNTRWTFVASLPNPANWFASIWFVDWSQWAQATLWQQARLARKAMSLRNMDCSVSSRHPTWEAKLCGRCKCNCASSGFNLFLQVGTICMEVYEWLFTNQNKLGSILCPLWFTLSCQHMWTGCELWLLSLWICRPHIGSSWSSSSSRTTGGGARKISPFECNIYYIQRN